MAQIQGSGLNNWANTAMVTDAQELLTTGSFTITNTVPISGNLGVQFDSADFLSVVQSGTRWDIGGSVYATGSVNVINTGREITAGSVIITNQVQTTGSTRVVGDVNVTQGTAPWVVLGSVNVNNSISATNDSVAALDSPHTGSATFIGGNYLGSLVPLVMQGGSEVLVAGSVFQGGGDWGIAGSVNISNTVAVSGNLGVQFDSADFLSVVQSGAEWSIGGSVYSTGSINVVNTVDTIGSMAITNTVAVSGNLGVQFDSADFLSVVQSGTEWAVGGSVYSTGSINVVNTERQITAGSVTITNTPTVQVGETTRNITRNVFTATGSGDLIIRTPTTGSRFNVISISFSTDQPMQALLKSSGLSTTYLTGSMSFGGGEGMDQNYWPFPLQGAAVDDVLKINLSPLAKGPLQSMTVGGVVLGFDSI